MKQGRTIQNRGDRSTLGSASVPLTTAKIPAKENNKFLSFPNKLRKSTLSLANKSAQKLFWFHSVKVKFLLRGSLWFLKAGCLSGERGKKRPFKNLERKKM